MNKFTYLTTITDFIETFSFHNLNIFQLIIWFFIYSFLGWAMECFVIRIQNGYWENRGFSRLPFCIIYGFGVFIAVIIFSPLQYNFFALYFSCALGATLFELTTAIIMKKLFGEFWWDYNNKKFNYKGMICLESTLGWGLIGIILFGFLNFRIENFVRLLALKYSIPISIILTFSYCIDFITQFKKNLIIKEKIIK